MGSISKHRLLASCLAIICLTQSASAAEPTRAASDALPTIASAKFSAERDALESKYRKQLLELAQWCDSHELKTQAKRSREWLPAREADKLYVFLLSDSIDPPA